MKNYINLDELNTLLKGSKPFILMWTMDGCPDCYAVLTKFKENYVKADFKAKMPLYLIETIAWRMPGNENLWQTIKDTYGLSNTFNKALGYSTGYVPSFQVITPDGSDHLSTNTVSVIITDMFVFQNEFVTRRLCRYFITTSYFDGVHAKKYLGKYQSEIGKSVSRKIVKKYNMSVRRYDLNAKYLTKFLDFYWKL